MKFFIIYSARGHLRGIFRTRRHFRANASRNGTRESAARARMRPAIRANRQLINYSERKIYANVELNNRIASHPRCSFLSCYEVREGEERDSQFIANDIA